MGNADKEAILAKNNPAELEHFILKNKPFILKCAYKHTKRFITVSDDEYSVSLLAFSDAVIGYEEEKGSFLGFAENVIRRRLVDFYRSQVKLKNELQVDPHEFETEPEEDESSVALKIQIADKVSYQADDSLKLEIEAVSTEFAKFGFRFYDLAQCSPKAEKTKDACTIAVKYILENKDILNEMHNTGNLPIKILKKNTGVPQKILERHRRYIIAAVVILSGEYPYLTEYLWKIKKEIKA
jgi:RNA polymerase sigma factor